MIDLTPRHSDVIDLRSGRRIGYSEYGDPDGRAMIWFHGTPGGSRQIPLAARRAAAELGVRLVAVERPGIGRSTAHVHANIAGLVDDVIEVADALDVERFAVGGLSGGGPYALACAARHPDRVVAAAVLGGVAPARGPEAAPGGLVGLAARLGPLVELIRVPLGHAMWVAVRAARPLAPQALELYAHFSPEGDRRVFAQPEMKAMFIDDLNRAATRQFHAAPTDIALFTRDWGFRLADIVVPVRFWHGDADNIVPLQHAQHMVDLVPGSMLTVRAGESHLGGLDATHEILETLLALWDRRE